MKQSMYGSGSGTYTTDLRDKEKNFLNFIIIIGEENEHPVYAMLNKRIEIVSDPESRKGVGVPFISIQESGITGVHIVIVHELNTENIGISNNNASDETVVLINGTALKRGEKVSISKTEDFYITISQGSLQSCILGSVKDYTNRNWESVRLFEILKKESKGLVTIGRKEDNDIVIDNYTVSGYHGYFQLKKNEVYFGERHKNPLGNRLNGTPIDKGCVIPDNSMLMLGAALFIYIGGLLIFSPFNNGCELSLNSVSKVVGYFSRKKILLEDVTLTIPGNSLVAVMGPSGAGKSTLVDLIRKNERLSTGSITLNGKEITRASEFQSCMGYVHQNNLLREKLTVYQTIEYYAKIRIGTKCSARKLDLRIEETMEKLAISNIRDSKISVLSGGQKKKVAIACELACDPQVLFLDEPTSGLDPASESEIMDILKNLTRDKKKGKTILVITHSLQHYDEFDKVIFIGKSEKKQTGYLCYYGSPKGIFEHFNVDDNDFEQIYKQASQIPEVAAQSYKELYIDGEAKV